MSDILDIHGNPIDPLWAAEFRGFFFGEGYLGISSWGKHPKGYTKLSARCQITSRSDDVDILREIASKLGGFVYEEHDGRKTTKAGRSYNANPYSVWRVVKKSEIERICRILEGGSLPSKKRAEIAVIRRFLTTVLEPGRRVSDEQYRIREECHAQIKALHQYSDC